MFTSVRSGNNETRIKNRCLAVAAADGMGAAYGVELIASARGLPPGGCLAPRVVFSMTTFGNLSVYDYPRLHSHRGGSPELLVGTLSSWLVTESGGGSLE